MTRQNGFDWTGEVPLRWRDLDAYGHVYYGEYLTLLDEARVAMLKAALGPTDPQFVVARVELDYRSQVTVEDGPLAAEVQVERVGNSSLTLRERLSSNDGRLVLESRVVVVLYDLDARKPRQVTDEERHALS
ncbi:MAG: acyl-CoA thioesterase [Nocardioidaceae bacterium]|nr:acyl-CoA thioesterase [Nocardioidaceae bacterium]